MHHERYYTLTASCPDQVGIISKVTQFFAEHGGWILESNFHSDDLNGHYFMRIEVKADSIQFPLDELCRQFTPIAEELQMTWQIADSAIKPRVVILVSRQEHCLYDLLARWKAGELSMEIPCVISNHDNLRGVVEWHGITFHHVPVSAAADNKDSAFAKIRQLFEDADGDFIVLARYMQILPEDFCQAYVNRILNIHHSFLPGFVGAKPYHQAYQRGVKLIGATCHYVTAMLDQGPIIEQDVIRIDHSDVPEDMVKYGRDIEKVVLARGLRYQLEHRVLVHGGKTVVFR